MRCYVFDLDGTLCGVGHRLHLIKPPLLKGGHLEPDSELPDMAAGFLDPSPPKPDWDAFFAACVDDPPIEPWVSLAMTLSRHCPLVFVSGRSDAVRHETRVWLVQQHFDPGPVVGNSRLFMREAGDHRPDHVVKGELLDQILAGGWEPIMAFEDRAQVVKMWRARRIPCAQVAEGDF